MINNKYWKYTEFYLCIKKNVQCTHSLSFLIFIQKNENWKVLLDNTDRPYIHFCHLLNIYDYKYKHWVSINSECLILLECKSIRIRNYHYFGLKWLQQLKILSAGLRILWLYPSLIGKDMGGGVLVMILNCIWLWGSSSKVWNAL